MTTCPACKRSLQAGQAGTGSCLIQFSRVSFFLDGAIFSLHTRHRSSEQYSQEKQSLQGCFRVQAGRFSGTYSLPGIPGMETNGMTPPLSIYDFY
jgi:hypothetical protein